jgi:hypothetical protein
MSSDIEGLGLRAKLYHIKWISIIAIMALGTPESFHDQLPAHTVVSSSAKDAALYLKLALLIGCIGEDCWMAGLNRFFYPEIGDAEAMLNV